MITIIICMIAGVIVACYSYYDGAVGIILGFLCGGLIGFMVAIMLPADLQVKVYTEKIVLLQDGNNLNGTFFLGCGPIDNKMKYTYYYQKNGMFRLNQIDCNLASIRYYDNEPKIVSYVEEPTHSIFNLFAIDFPQESYIIYVPKGTIKTNYSLDAQ